MFKIIKIRQYDDNQSLSFPVTERPKARVCGCSLAGIAGSNPPGAWTFVLCVVSKRQKDKMQDNQDKEEVWMTYRKHNKKSHEGDSKSNSRNTVTKDGTATKQSLLPVQRSCNESAIITHFFEDRWGLLCNGNELSSSIISVDFWLTDVWQGSQNTFPYGTVSLGEWDGRHQLQNRVCYTPR